MKLNEINFDSKKWKDRADVVREMLIAVKENSNEGIFRGNLPTVINQFYKVYAASRISKILKQDGHIQRIGSSEYMLFYSDIPTLEFAQYLIIKAKTQQVEYNNPVKISEDAPKPFESPVLNFDIAPNGSTVYEDIIKTAFQKIASDVLQNLSNPLLNADKDIRALWIDYVSEKFPKTNN